MSRPLFEYAVAVGTVVVALLVRELLDPVLGDAVPFVTLFTALLVLLPSVRPGPFLAATVVAWVGGLVLFVQPRFTLTTAGLSEWLQVLLFGFTGVAATTAAYLSHRAQERRRQVDQELARRGEELRIITDAVPALISYVDAHGRYRFVNARYTEWFGRAHEELVGRHVREVLGDAGFERVRSSIEGALAGRRCRFEGELSLTTGKTLEVVVEYVPNVRPDGSVAGFYALVTDVSERKRAEAAQARLASIVEASGDAIISLSLDGCIETWNRGAEGLFGYTVDEAIGQTMALVLPDEPSSEEQSVLERVRRGEVVGPYDTVRRAKDGRLIDVSVTVSPVRDAAGRVVGASKVDRDITDRKQAEQELRDSRARERTYLEHLPVGVWFANEKGELIFANEEGRRIWAGARMVGPSDFHAYEAYWHATDRRLQTDEWALARVLRTGEPTLGEEIDIVAFDGARRTILNTAVPVRDSEGALIGVVVMNHDITDRKRAEAVLREADQRKDEFIATLSHELRNPLAAIRTAVELLARGEQVEAIPALLQRQVAQMVRLIDDLLDVSRITHGSLELQRARHTVQVVVEQAVEAARPWIEGRQQTLEVVLPSQRVEVDGDVVRLVQVVTNLLSNACRYTDPGGRITVGIERAGPDAVISVSDTGIGIPADKLEAIFEVFSRLADPGHGEGGLGIGLTLSRRLVELHGGTLRATSDGPGHGSTFTVRLPTIAANAGVEAARTPCEPSTGTSSRRVLVVDDNVDAADTLAMLLSAWGHDARTAYDGASALTEAAAFRPELVLLDLGLPDMDGTDVCRSLRAEAWGRDVTVVALSGWGQESDKQRTAAAGFDEHLTKPADPRDVARLLG